MIAFAYIPADVYAAFVMDAVPTYRVLQLYSERGVRADHLFRSIILDILQNLIGFLKTHCAPSPSVSGTIKIINPETSIENSKIACFEDAV